MKCYILFTQRRSKMKLIINHSSVQPIYEQISGQIKDLIIHGELRNC